MTSRCVSGTPSPSQSQPAGARRAGLLLGGQLPWGHAQPVSLTPRAGLFLEKKEKDFSPTSHLD